MLKKLQVSLYRCTIYNKLEEAGVPVPKHAVLNRNKAGATG